MKRDTMLKKRFILSVLIEAIRRAISDLDQEIERTPQAYRQGWKDNHKEVQPLKKQ